MTRLATTLIVLTASAIFARGETGANPAMDALNQRLAALESRLGEIEKALGGETAPHAYPSTYEATNASVTAAPSVTSAPAPTASETYVIADGDSLGSIAKRFGVERSALLEANRLSEGQPIYIGETLRIPGVAPAPAPAPTKPQPETTNVAASTTPAPANEKSVVVGKTETSDSHTVAKGDTLTSISKKYGTTVASLKQANGLKTDVISLGQTLTLPAPGATVADSGNTTGNQNSSSMEYEYENDLLRTDETYGYYTVRKGDNLYALARDFFTSMPELQRLNRLGESTLIYPGNELIVPTSKYNSHHGGGVAQR